MASLAARNHDRETRVVIIGRSRPLQQYYEASTFTDALPQKRSDAQ